MDDGRPPPRAGKVFVSVHDGRTRSTADNQLHEYYDFSVTLTMRVTAPLDRVGDQQIARNVPLSPVGWREGFNHKVEQLRSLLHMNWSMTVLQSQTPASANDNLAAWVPWTSTYGFVEPARYRGVEPPRLVGGEWFGADADVAEVGVKAEMRFEGARRFQPQVSSTVQQSNLPVVSPLAVHVQPTSGSAQSPLAGPVTVRVVDSSGNVLTGVFVVVMEVGGTNTSGGPVSGTVVKVTDHGVASFAPVFPYPGTYTLKFSTRALASGASLTASVETVPFTVTGSAVGTVRTVTSTGNPTVDGAALKAVVNAAASGDLTMVGAGTFAVVGKMTSSGSVRGAGVDVTVITSDNGGGATNTDGLQMLSNTTLSDLTFTPISADFGSVNLFGPVSNVVLNRVKVNGVGDAFLFSSALGDVSNVQMTYCQGSSMFDTCNTNTGSHDVTVVQAYCDFACTASFSSPNLRALANDSLATGMITVTSYGCTMAFSDPIPVGTVASAVQSNTAGATYNVYGAAVTFPGFDGGFDELHAFAQNAGKINGFGVTYPADGTVDGTPSVVTKLAVTTQPATAAAGAVLSAVAVAAQDSSSVTQNPTAVSVQVSLRAVSGSGVLSGTTTKAGVAGVTTFSDLRVSAAGVYVLVLASLGLPTVETNQFTVT